MFKRIFRSASMDPFEQVEKVKQLIEYYFEQGFWLIRIKRGTKEPTENWQDRPKPTKKEVIEWLRAKDGIAVAHGHWSNNTLALDADNPKLYAKLYPADDWATRTIVVISSIFKETHRGKDLKKRHIIIRTKRTTHTKVFPFEHGELRIIGDGNYSILPPTIHPDTKKAYTLESDMSKVGVMLYEGGDFTEDFVKRLQDRLNYKVEKEKVAVDDLFLPRERGERHFWQIRIVTWLKLCKTDKEVAWQKICEWNEQNPEPLNADELKYQFEDIWEHPLTLIQFDQRPKEYFSKEVLEAAEQALEDDPFNHLIAAVSELHTGDEELVKSEYISALSAKISNPSVNTWAIGTSQIGKSHLKYSILEATQPRDYYEIFTSASPLSLFYFAKQFGEDVFDGLLIYIDEVEASSATLPTLRTLTGQTDITPRHLSVYDAEVLDLKITGRRVVWFTSVKAFGNDQLRNRFLFCNPDESIDQNIKIAELQTRTYFENESIDRTKIDTAKAMTSLIVANTKDKDVDFSYGFTWSLARYRYLLPVFISMLKICTKIHYKKREINEKGNLISTPEDFKIVKNLWKTIEKEILFRVNKKCQLVLDNLGTSRADASKISEVAAAVNRSTFWVRKQLEELSEADLVNADKEEEGKRMWVYWQAHLPKVEDVQLLKEVQIKVIREFERTRIANTAVCSATPLGGKPSNSLKSEENASFRGEKLNDSIG